MRIYPEMPGREEQEEQQDKLRRDFDYPAAAIRLLLYQKERHYEQGSFFVLKMEWQEVRIELRYNRLTGMYEPVEVWKSFSRVLEPRAERYL